MTNFYPPGLEHEKQNLAIDFDGVIHNADKGWGNGTCYGEPLPGAIDAIKRLSEDYNIYIDDEVELINETSTLIDYEAFGMPVEF